MLEGLKYANSHEWVKHDGSVATIGITDHAQVTKNIYRSEELSFRSDLLVSEIESMYVQGHLGEVVFVELPEEKSSLSKDKSFGAVESVKATSEILSPISGEVIEVNTKLTDSPGLVSFSSI